MTSRSGSRPMISNDGMAMAPETIIGRPQSGSPTVFQWFHGCPSIRRSRRVSGMKRASLFVVVAMILAACAGSPSSQPPEQSQAAGQSQAQGASQAPSGGGGGGGGSDGAALAAAANAVTDWCTLMPADLVAELVPGEAILQAEEFPSRCTASNQVQALQVSYQGSSGAERGADATSIPGIAEDAWLEPSYPVDDAYLTVILGPDPNGLGSATLYVEMSGHDGIDHGDDAVAVAKAVIAQLR